MHLRQCYNIVSQVCPTVTEMGKAIISRSSHSQFSPPSGMGTNFVNTGTWGTKRACTLQATSSWFSVTHPLHGGSSSVSITPLSNLISTASSAYG